MNSMLAVSAKEKNKAGKGGYEVLSMRGIPVLKIQVSDT